MSGRDMPAYDADLLAQAPEPTKEQKQSGYQTKGLLDEPRVPSPSRTPAPPVPEAEASGTNGRTVDLLEKGSLDDRSAGAVAAAAPVKRPWYRSPKWLIIIGVIVAAIIIAAVVGGVVGSRNANNNNSANIDKAGDGSSPNTPSGATPGQVLNPSASVSSTSAAATDSGVINLNPATASAASSDLLGKGAAPTPTNS
ncbi:hypothetical protein DACRYDRAFT_25281 [Dacryopinax primogenitus]|uniref:Uncharacterized protein n=1 Tax=Dacryopinax primogenitus (strain DJM 731) TaxID=1858805 RepID=M5FPM1_DACPD|nr:uncharacterized protein DACRYDRAFT_25281 [Dacryopinax primogenitus]EJT97163.1 hypothetical protein DACRYDRAFT_25281 [Dacryopinax primogenitus]